MKQMAFYEISPSVKIGGWLELTQVHIYQGGW